MVDNTLLTNTVFVGGVVAVITAAIGGVVGIVQHRKKTQVDINQYIAGHFQAIIEQLREQVDDQDRRMDVMSSRIDHLSGHVDVLNGFIRENGLIPPGYPRWIPPQFTAVHITSDKK